MSVDDGIGSVLAGRRIEAQAIARSAPHLVLRLADIAALLPKLEGQ